MQVEDIERSLAALGQELQNLGVQKPIRILTLCGGQPSVLLRSSDSVSTMRFLAPPGYTTMPPLCPDPGLTRLLRTFHTCANGYASRPQSHLPDAISFVGIACSPTHTNLLSTPSRLLPSPPLQRLSSPTSHVPPSKVQSKHERLQEAAVACYSSVEGSSHQHERSQPCVVSKAIFSGRCYPCSDSSGGPDHLLSRRARPWKGAANSCRFLLAPPSVGCRWKVCRQSG